MNDVRPEFIATIKQLQPLDAAILRFAKSRRTEQRKFNQGDLIDALKNQRPTAIQLSLDHLIKLGCISTSTQNGVLTLLSYGIEFMIACEPHTTKQATVTA